MPILSAILAAAAVTAADPFNGVWVLDPARSPGSRGTQQLTITVRGDAETYFTEWALPTGQRNITGYEAVYDDAPHPAHTFTILPGGEVRAGEMQVRVRRIDARHRETRHVRDGKVVRLLRREMAEDGKTLVSEMFDADAAGTLTPTARLVFDRR
jgi:hypothetical protein